MDAGGDVSGGSEDEDDWALLLLLLLLLPTGEGIVDGDTPASASASRTWVSSDIERRPGFFKLSFMGIFFTLCFTKVRGYCVLEGGRGL